MKYRTGDVLYSCFNEGVYLVVRVDALRLECDLLVLNTVLDEELGGIQRLVAFDHLDVTTHTFPKSHGWR